MAAWTPLSAPPETLAKRHHAGDGTGSHRPRVAIIGAGFAGLTAAQGLARADCDVVLIDRNRRRVLLGDFSVR